MDCGRSELGGARRRRARAVLSDGGTAMILGCANVRGLGQDFPAPVTQPGWNYEGAYDTPMTVAIGPTEAPAGDYSPDYASAIPQVISAVAQWDLERKAYELNLVRAQQGLPPIDASQLAPGVNVGLTPQAQQMAQVAMIGAGALVVFYLLTRRGR